MPVRPRFSIRAMMVAVAFCAVPLALLSQKIRESRARFMESRAAYHDRQAKFYIRRFEDHTRFLLLETPLDINKLRFVDTQRKADGWWAAYHRRLADKYRWRAANPWASPPVGSDPP